MSQAKAQHLLADEQYGSHKGCSAIVQCLNKCLWYDLICSTRTAAALCSNDAKSCYNHIVLLIAALCMCRLGASNSVAFSMVHTLQGMIHHISTIFGDSRCSSHKMQDTCCSMSSNQIMIKVGIHTCCCHYLCSKWSWNIIWNELLDFAINTVLPIILNILNMATIRLLCSDMDYTTGVLNEIAINALHFADMSFLKGNTKS